MANATLTHRASKGLIGHYLLALKGMPADQATQLDDAQWDSIANENGLALADDQTRDLIVATLRRVQSTVQPDLVVMPAIPNPRLELF